jgi:cytochrome P450
MSNDATAERPPGPDSLPVVGNTHQFASDPLSFYLETAREYGPVAYYEVGGEPFYQVSSPETVEQVLVQENERFRKGDLFQESLGDVTGDGLLTSGGEFWRRQRHRIQPAFHPEALERYAPTMAEFTERALDDWTDGEVRNVHDDMMQLTVEIAAEALFDVDIRSMEGEISDALEAVMDRGERRMKRPVDVPEWVPTPTNRRYQRSLDALDRIADRIIADHDAGGDDVVSMLLSAAEQHDEVDHDLIRDEVVTLLLAGHETTALALSYTLHLLATHPDSLSRLHAEVDDVLGDRTPTYDDLDDLTYTERVVEEGMRVHPPVQGLVREATEDVEIGGYRVPEGATVSLQQWVLHRDPDHYDDPETFRPERWTDEMRAALPKYAYFPFGGGPRRCIGDRFAMQEARLALATMARDWTFEPVTEELSFSPSITLRPDGPVRLRVGRR